MGSARDSRDPPQIRTSCDGQGSTCATGAGDRPQTPSQGDYYHNQPAMDTKMENQDVHNFDPVQYGTRRMFGNDFQPQLKCW